MPNSYRPRWAPCFNACAAVFLIFGFLTNILAFEMLQILILVHCFDYYENCFSYYFYIRWYTYYIIILDVWLCTSQLGKESSAAHDAEIRRRTMARKKAMDYQTRALRLHLGAPKFTRGRQHVDIQTSTHLEEVRTSEIRKNVYKSLCK